MVGKYWLSLLGWVCGIVVIEEAMREALIVLLLLRKFIRPPYQRLLFEWQHPLGQVCLYL